MVRFAYPALLLSPCLFSGPWPAVPWAFWGWIAAAVPLEILAMLLYMRAIRDSPLALTLPYLAFTPVFTTLTGAAVLGEAVSLQGLCGILLVALGAYALNLESLQLTTVHAWLAPFRAFAHERGSPLMLAVATLYSLTSVLGKGALHYVPPQFFGPVYFALLAPLTLALLSFHQPGLIRVLRRNPVWPLAIGALMALMVLTHFLAIAQIEAAYMIAVKRTSVLFGMVYGAWLFGERHLLRHLAAGTVMISGVALLAG